MVKYVSKDIICAKMMHCNFRSPDMTVSDFINDELPSADVQPINQWISVKDRLPDIDKRVLVYIPKPDNHSNIEIAYISEGNDDYPYWVLRDKSQFYNTTFHYVSHWMPMPESPQD